MSEPPLNSCGDRAERQSRVADAILVGGVVAAVDRRAREIVEIEIEARAAREVVGELEVHDEARGFVDHRRGIGRGAKQVVVKGLAVFPQIHRHLLLLLDLYIIGFK